MFKKSVQRISFYLKLCFNDGEKWLTSSLSMGLRLRRSVKLFPDVRINLSLSGVSATIGPRGASINIGPSGTYANLGLPGTGVSYRTRLDKPTSSTGTRSQPTREVPLQDPRPPSPLPLQRTDWTEYRSLAPDFLSSPELRPLSNLIAEVIDRRRRLGRELQQTLAAIRRAERKISLGRMPPFGVFARRRLAAIGQIKAILESQHGALSDQLESTAIDADFELSAESRAAFADLVQQFDALRLSSAIWDVSESARVDRASTRSAASQNVKRHSVSFVQTALEAMASEFDSLHLSNANGGDLYFFPCFLAVRRNDNNFALIDIRQLNISASSIRFIEDERLPSDSERVGTAWARSNKDGSPDRRFTNNYQIPVLRYGEFLLSSRTGLNEAYMISNSAVCERFGGAFHRYIATLPPRESEGSSSNMPLTEALPPLDIPLRPHVPSLMSAASWLTVCVIVVSAIGLSGAWGVGSIKDLLPASLVSRGPASPEAAAPTPVSDTPAHPSSGNSVSEAEFVPTGVAPIGTSASSSPPEEIPTGPLTTSEIIDLQRKLNALGFNAGSADGIVGRRTIAAVKAANPSMSTDYWCDRQGPSGRGHEAGDSP